MKYEVGDLFHSNDFTSWYEGGLHTLVNVDSGDTILPYYLQAPSGAKKWFSEKGLDKYFTRLPKEAENQKVTGEPVPAKTPSIQTTLMELLLDELELHMYHGFEISYVKDGKKVSVSVEDVNVERDPNDILMDGKSAGTGLFNDGESEEWY